MATLINRCNLLLAIFCASMYIYLFINANMKRDSKERSNYELEINKKLSYLENSSQTMRNEILLVEQYASKLLARLEYSINWKRVESLNVSEPTKAFQHSRNWSSPIPILVFVCNRSLALRDHLNKLIRYRPSVEMFPIIVSHDCEDQLVSLVISRYGDSVQYIKHVHDNTIFGTTASHKLYLPYYRIARHYRLGLSYVFDRLKYTSVIVTEDDLDIAPDFFNYFASTRYLLDRDQSLYCVSAWNDNGKLNLIDGTRGDVLYRTDFFPGLGWMMSRDLWNEFGPIWPNGFWDDWMRDPFRRRNRSCIRPEVSRTGMSLHGRAGASNGLFFDEHLRKIAVNQNPVNFSAMNLDYLLKENYDGPFFKRVYSAPLITVAMTKRRLIKGSEYRIEYSKSNEYLYVAKELQIMKDFKAGVPRTAYHGIVTCFIDGARIFIAPKRSKWLGYGPS